MHKFILYFLMAVFLLQNEASIAQQPADSIDYNAVTGDIIIKPGANVPSIVRSRMFVTVTVNKKTVFVGEPVLVTYKFYTALNSKSQVSRHPQFANCSVVELPYNPDPFLDSFKGKPYAVYIIRRVALTPLQAGNLILGPAYVDNIAELIKEDDPFHPEQYSITLCNQPQILPVYALPTKSKPSGFSGITGKFFISARVTKSTVSAGENDHLIISIKGTGNIESIGLPAIRWPSNTEHFDGTDTPYIQTDSFPIRGVKTFDIPFLAKQPGNVEILPIEFTFFNPSTQRYSYIQSDTIKLKVTEKQSTVETFDTTASVDVTNRKYLWIVAAIAIIVVFGLFVNHFKNKIANQPIEKKNEIAEQAEMVIPPYEIFNNEFQVERINNLNDSVVFFSEAKKLIFQTLQNKFNMWGATENAILKQLESRQGDIQLYHSIQSFLEAYNIAMFSPTQQEMNEFKVLFQNILKRLQD